MDIEPLAGREHFPAISKCTYLNAASVALMYKCASEAAVDWQRDLADFVRFSPHLYNSSADVDYALEILDRALGS